MLGIIFSETILIVICTIGPLLHLFSTIYFK